MCCVDILMTATMPMCQNDKAFQENRSSVHRIPSKSLHCHDCLLFFQTAALCSAFLWSDVSPTISNFKGTVAPRCSKRGARVWILPSMPSHALSGRAFHTWSHLITPVLTQSYLSLSRSSVIIPSDHLWSSPQIICDHPLRSSVIIPSDHLWSSPQIICDHPLRSSVIIPSDHLWSSPQIICDHPLRSSVIIPSDHLWSSPQIICDHPLRSSVIIPSDHLWSSLQIICDHPLRSSVIIPSDHLWSSPQIICDQPLRVQVITAKYVFYWLDVIDFDLTLICYTLN